MLRIPHCLDNLVVIELLEIFSLFRQFGPTSMMRSVNPQINNGSILYTYILRIEIIYK
jgi:hypothetical protein